MEVVGKFYPKRVLIKYKAKEQLRLALDDSEIEQLLDELFHEISRNFLSFSAKSKICLSM